MKIKTIFFALLLFVLGNAISTWWVYAAEFKDYVQPPVELSAKNVLPEDLLQGGNYKVEQKVKNDGLINTYELKSNYGPLKVESTGELLIRVNELKALTVMEEMDRKKVFGDALVSGVKGTVKGATELVKSPIESGKNLVKGTGQFISNLGESIFSDDPNQDNVVKVALGYDVAKRHFAFEFGIDPYTDYAPVVDRLGEIARAAVAGGITPKVAMAGGGDQAELVACIKGVLHDLIRLRRHRFEPFAGIYGLDACRGALLRLIGFVHLFPKLTVVAQLVTCLWAITGPLAARLLIAIGSAGTSHSRS